jgi:hypothetical protein
MSKTWSRGMYPEQWEWLSFLCRFSSGWRCEICGIEDHTWSISKAEKPYLVILAACHINPCDEQNNNPALFAGCPTCHARYDAYYKSLILSALKRARKADSEKDFDTLKKEVLAKFPTLTRQDFELRYKKVA